MERETLKMELERIEKNYGADKFVMDQELYDLWYEVVKDTREDVFHQAVNICLRKNAYAPNIAGVMIYYDTIMKKNKEREDSMMQDLSITLSEWYQKKTDVVVNAWMNYCKRNPEGNMVEESLKLMCAANDFLIACRLKGEELPPLEKFIGDKYEC